MISAVKKILLLLIPFVFFSCGMTVEDASFTAKLDTIDKLIFQSQYTDAQKILKSIEGKSYTAFQYIAISKRYINMKNFESAEKILAKAYLFLEACAPLSNRSFNDNFIGFYPEWTILLLGSRYWRKNKDKDVLCPTGTNVDLGNFKKPSFQVTETFKVDQLDVNQGATAGNPYAMPAITLKEVSESRVAFSTITKGSSLSYNDFQFIEHDILVEEFKKWALTEFVVINNELELKGKNNDVFLPADIEGLSLIVKSFKSKTEQTISEIQTTINGVQCNILKNLIGKVTTTDKIKLSDLLQQILEKRVYDNYSFICDTSDGGLALGLNYKRDISRQLFQKKIKNITVFSPISTKITIDTDKIKKSFNGFTNTLCQLYERNNGFENSINGSERVEDLATDIMLRNDDLKLSLYLTLKNLYDRWLCGCGKEKWDLDYYITDNNLSDASAVDERVTLCEYNKFFFIDSFYNDISSKICFNMHTFKELINSVIRDRIGDDGTMTNGMKFQGMSVYQFMASILQKNSMTFLAVPCFNTYKTEESIRELFTPYSWFDRGEPRGTSYVGIYPHQVSSHLNIEGANGYQYPNDGWDIADVNGDFKDTLEIGDLAIIDGGYVMPAFGVTYGKQDQSYFKKVTVNMDKPQVTEYSIGATLDIANHYGENQKVQTFVGQDLYKVYSNYSYTCTVEMMGNAMITPLMYFQLNNIPMFRGAYMVIKVEHSISQGNMTTVFTGVRMSKNKIPYVTPTLEGEVIEDNLVDNGSGNSNNNNNNNNNRGGGNTIIPNTPTSANEAINRFIEAARSAVVAKYGEQPADSNRVPNPPELPIQGHDKNYAWCAIFVAWCSEKAGLNNTIIGGTTNYDGTKLWYKGKNWTQPYTTTCQTHYEYYTKLGRFIEKNADNKVNNPPQMGDLILFLNNDGSYESSGRKYGHIGIVESYNAETGDVTYIHGNNSTNVVARKTEKYETNRIGGFARPPFEDAITPNTGSNNNSNSNSTTSSTQSTTSTTQPSADTSVQSGDDIIITSVEDKLRLINAMIWKECGNINGRTGDTGTTYPAYGILQIRQMMLDDVRVIINRPPSRLKGPYLQNIDSLIPSENLDRNTQVQEFIAIMEWYNKPQNKKTYISNSSIEKDPTQISWSMKYCCAKWNGAVKGKPKEPANPNYFKDVRDKYNTLKNDPTKMPEGNSNGWTPNAAFNSFFS